MLHQEVISSEPFKAWAKQSVVLVTLDFPRNKQLPPELKKQNDALKAKFNVPGFPTIYFVKPDGEQIGPRYGHIEGGVTKWLEGAKQILSES